MALASYFSKDCLAISQVLNKGSHHEFEELLNNNIVGIAVDDHINNTEGKCIADLTVRLISRLYPRIKFVDLSGNNQHVLQELSQLSLRINSRIEITQESPTVALVIGNTVSKLNCPVFHIGSNGWVAKLSKIHPVGIGNTAIPFAAGFAACFGAANVFRYVFNSFIDEPEYDEEFNISLVDFKNSNEQAISTFENVQINEATLVGFGAIGNGFIWALNNTIGLRGLLTIVEPQTLELSNLQRYVLAEERHIEKPKNSIAEELSKATSITYKLHQQAWGEYISKASYKETKVIVAVDTAKDRILIQSSLPKEILNAYTDTSVIGITRHSSFGNEACLACTYMREKKKKDHSMIVAENLNLVDKEIYIRNYLYYNNPVDSQLLEWIASANTIPLSELEKFKGTPMNQFYSIFVCGGGLMQLRKDGMIVKSLEAPLAFQSALAGILLAADFVLDCIHSRKITENVTQLYPLAPIRNGVNPDFITFPKDETGKCICNDEDFITAYKKKWEVTLV